MAFGNLPTQIFTFAFSTGLNTKGDKRAKNPPMLDVCTDVEFDDLGGLRTRYPYDAVVSREILNDGDVADCRRIEPFGTEQLLFTKDSLYSRSTEQSKWVRKATHLAVKIEEQSPIMRTGDQAQVDRAELSGTVVYAYCDNPQSTSSKVYVAAFDATTGAMLVSPTAIGTNGCFPRLVPLTNKILLFFNDGTTLITNNLVALAIDPADVATSIGVAPTTILAAASAGPVFDAVAATTTSAAVVSQRAVTTSYEVKLVTEALAVTSSTKARVADGPVALSRSTGGTYLQIVRANGTNIQGDLLNATTLADVFTAQAIGTSTSIPISSIAVAHRSVQNSGQYRAYAFWYTAADNLAKYNWVDTGNTLGTQANFVRRMGLASRAFDYDGSVYVWGEFTETSSMGGASGKYGAQLQNTYFLWRDDVTFHAKAAAAQAGGMLGSMLPSVQLVDGATGFVFAGTFRRIIEIGTQADNFSYAARAPREVKFTFDSNEARRCVQLGNTLYIACGEGVLQYDGSGLYEVGFHYYPYYFDPTQSGAGSLTNGTYAYRETWRWDNAKGEIDRSTTASSAEVTIAAGPGGVVIANHTPLFITHKPSVAVEIWRTAVNPNPDSPFYLTTSKDPSTAAPNNYVTNGTGATLASFNDRFSDTTLTAKETHYENGSVLENTSPPPATIIVEDADRLYLAGIAGEPNTVRYSKLRGDGEVAAFHESLRFELPPDGGPITGLALYNRTLFILRETAVYIATGSGFDNTGGGSNFQVDRVPGDVGALNQESIAVTDRGVMFKSWKGWQLTNGQTIEYIGGPVAAFDGHTVVATTVMEAQHQVRILVATEDQLEILGGGIITPDIPPPITTDATVLPAGMLVFDTLVGQWGLWSVVDGVHACIWNGRHVYLTDTGPRMQLTEYTGVTYGYDVETAWIKINELQGRGIVRAVQLLGEVRSSHDVQVRVARNYESDGAGGWDYFDDDLWPITPTVVGGPLQLKVAPSIKRPIQAIKLRFTAKATGGGSPTTETAKLTGISIAVAVEDGLFSGLPAAQKV